MSSVAYRDPGSGSSRFGEVKIREGENNSQKRKDTDRESASLIKSRRRLG